MSKPKVVVEKWGTGRGRSPSHCMRLMREMFPTGQCVLGVQGKAADQPAYSLRNLLLADVTGDMISTAPERAAQWSSLVRDRSSPSVVNTKSEADKIFRARLSQDDILPGPNLGSGVDAVLTQMADLRHNVPFGKRLVPFTEIVSYLGLRIDLMMGGNEGPQAIVHCGLRHDRYMSNVSQPDIVRNARCPVETVVTINVRHLIILAALLADTIQAFLPVSKDDDAGAAPTAPASTTEYPDTTSVDTNAESHQGTRNTPEGNPCSRLSASSSFEDSASSLVSGELFDEYFRSQASCRHAA